MKSVVDLESPKFSMEDDPCGEMYAIKMKLESLEGKRKQKETTIQKENVHSGTGNRTANLRI